MLYKNLRSKPEKIYSFAGVMLILLLAIIAPFFGGYDYKVAYRGDALAGTFGAHSGFPYPASWFIFPFAILPEIMGYILWNIVNAACFIIAIRYWRGNILAFSIFVGTFWTFYGGQIEGFMAGALVLTMLSNPMLVGLGITILSFKPQIGLLPIIFLLVNKKDWKILVIPAIVYILSIIKWGWWIPQWLNTIQSINTTGMSMVSMVSLFPYGLFLLPLLWKYKTSINIWMYIQSLAIPYYPIYSLAPVFTISTPPIWFSIATWAFYLSLFWYLPLSKFGFIFPLTLLVYEIWKIEKANKSVVPRMGETI